MKRWYFCALVALGVIALLSLSLSGCGTSTASVTTAVDQTSASVGTSASVTASSSDTTTAPSGEQKVLKVGSLLALDLPNALGIQRWMTIITKTINEQGGWKIGNDVYKIDYKVYDCGNNDPIKTRAAVEKAVLQDGVKYLLAGFGVVTQVTQTVTEPNKVLDIGMDLTGAVLKSDANYFINGNGVFFNAGMAYTYLTEYKNKGAKRYITAGPDNEMIHAGIANQMATAKSVGFEALDPVFFQMDTVDFGPVATKMLSANPDFIDLSYTDSNQAINLLAALKDAGYKGFISPANMDQTALDKAIKVIGKDYLEGAAIVSQDPRGRVTDERMLAFYAAYEKEYGNFNCQGMLWAAPWFYFEDAVNSTQSLDATTLASYLHDFKKPIMSVEGNSLLVARPDLKNNKTVESIVDAYVGEIKDGKIVITRTVSLKDDYLASVIAYGLGPVYEAYWQQYGKPSFPDQESLLDFPDVSTGAISK